MSRLLQALVRKMCRAIKTATKRDILHAHIRRKKISNRLVDSVLNNVLMEGETCEELHHAVEIAGVVSERVGNGLIRHLGRLVILNECYNAMECLFLFLACAVAPCKNTQNAV